MPQTLAAEHSSKTINPALLALKPRQVLLSRPDMGKRGESKTLDLKPDQKAILLRSVAQYLDRCGFSKCLKKLLSEAEIEKQDSDSTLPDLEEIFCEYLKERDHEAGDSIKQKTEDVQTHGKKEGENSLDDYDKEKKGKKKKKKEPKSEVTQEKSENGSSKNKKEIDVNIEEPKNCGSSVAEESKDTHEDAEKGKKGKKMQKKESKSEVTKETVEDGSFVNKKETDVELGEGHKDKKKKNKSKSRDLESLNDNTDEKNEAEKVSKKRKRPENEEENKQTTGDKEDEESKRRKKDANVDTISVQKTPAKHPNVEENGKVETAGAKSASQKSGKKQPNGSIEPKKTFQRVNIEEVQFIDERLKDNSYWAKDGADSGYGAKAEEVLGQVRGKDFRHEKTKKKRGSYRGGLIDLHSHSVKFNYSDEE